MVFFPSPLSPIDQSAYKSHILLQRSIFLIINIRGTIPFSCSDIFRRVARYVIGNNRAGELCISGDLQQYFMTLAGNGNLAASLQYTVLAKKK